MIGDAVGRQLEIETRENKRDAREANLLLDSLYERLEDAEEDILGVPVSTTLAKICRALGVTPDWSLWETDDWAMEDADLCDEPGPYGAKPLPRTRIEIPPGLLAEPRREVRPP